GRGGRRDRGGRVRRPMRSAARSGGVGHSTHRTNRRHPRERPSRLWNPGPMPAARRVVVVGGGIAGLAAAYALARSDRAPEVVVVEGATRSGGKLRVEEV